MIRELERLGIPTPKAVADVEEARGIMRASANAKPTDAFATAILSGQVTPKNALKTLTDAAHQRMQAEVMLSLVRSVEPIFDRAIRLATRAAGPEILESLRPVFDQAVQDIREAANVIGYRSSEKTVLDLGPQASEAWHQRKAAIKVLDGVRSVRFQLGQAGYGPKTQSATWWVTGLRTDVDLDRAERTTGGLVGLAESFEMHLNSPAEIEAMIAGLEPTQANAAAARKAARAKVDNRVDRAWLDVHEAELAKASE